MANTSLRDKIVFITGATSGIGQACSETFAEQGARLIITGRRTERLSTLADKLHDKHQSDVLPLTLDITQREAINECISQLPVEYSDIDLLINNAGLALRTDPIQTADPDNWDIMIDTNVKGLLNVSRAIFPGMIRRKSGHIINIGSIAGHDYYPGGNVYCATKHAVKAITKTLQIDLLGTGVRAGSVDPGAVHTEFSQVRWDDEKRSDEFYKAFDPLTPADIANAVVYCASQPAHVNIAEMIVMPSCQASANHLHRKKSDTPKDSILK